jgi:hypothetical protein
MSSPQSTLDFNARVVKLGVATLSAGIIANFIPVIYVWIVYGVIPPPSDLLKIATVAVTAFGASWVVQLITYFPVLGMPGTYVSFLVGSVAEIRLPASTVAQKVTGVEPGTPQAEVISTIAIAGSVLVSAFIITLFTFIGSAVVPMLPKFIQKAFNFILPALFAAVLLELSSKYLKVGLAALAFAVLFSFVGSALKLPNWLWPIFVISGGIAMARIFYSLEKKGEGRAGAKAA